MKILSTLSDAPAAAALVLAFSLVLSLALPATARADIYKWNDEQGRTYLSNVPPAPSDKAKNVQLLVKENGPAAAPAQARATTPTEQALLGRIESLERQLQAQPYPVPMAPPAMPYGGYSAPPVPPAAYGNYAGYSAGAYDYPSYYPPYYPNYYYPAAYYGSSIYPVRGFVSRPVFAGSRGGSFHHVGGHRGRR